MSIGPTSLAASNAVGVKNVQFLASADVLPRKILLIGTYDPAKTATVDDVPKLVLSPEDVGDQFGFGFMLHRLAVRANDGSEGVETWVIPQAEEGGAVVATGDIDFTGSTGVVAGTLYLYIAGILVQVTITDAMTPALIAAAVVAAVSANSSLPVTAVVNIDAVDFTSKTKGPWGNDISLTFNWGAGQELPTGVVAAVTDMASGTGLPDIADALDGLGTGDNQNLNNFTDCVHGYGTDSTTLDAISTYNGTGNLFTGNYSKTVARPFRFISGDVATGSAGLTAVLVIANGRKSDRSSGVVSAPGSPNHPEEIAAVAMGVMAATNNVRAEESYIDKVLPDIIPGALADQWTADYDNRNLAVTDGVSPTFVKNNVLVLQNVLTFYHPDNVSVASNGYRSQRNISIIQNIMNAVKLNFDLEKWQGITIVSDVAKVTNVTSRLKARDTDAVLDDLVTLATAFAGNAWLFEADFTIENMTVTIRSGGLGFDNVLPIILSGEGGIMNTVVEFDTSLAVLLQ